MRARETRTVAIVVGLVVALTLGASTAALAASRGPARLPHLQRGTFVDGAVLVGFVPGTPLARQRAIDRAAGARSTRRIAPGIVLLRLPDGRVPAAIAALRARWQVRFAEPDFLLREDGVPNDKWFPLQWSMHNTGQAVDGESAGGTAGDDISATAAWDVSTGSGSVVIAETDTGVDYTHPDLQANVWSNPGGVGRCAGGTHGFNVVNPSSPCDPMDDDTSYGGHGTHVAGILGAVGNNGAGVTGVNWKTTILPVKWLDSSGYGSTDQLISALHLVLQAQQAGVNVRVVNDSATFVGTAYSQALSDEIDTLGSNDILFVTAAGNSGGNKGNNDDPAYRRYPCGYDRPTEICVTASDQNDQLPSWANYGFHTVDLAAPGDNIYSTLRNGTYGYISGGSMASPLVAGSAALILSVPGYGNESPQDLKSRILGTVDPIPALTGKVITGGRLDLCHAMPGCRPPKVSLDGPSAGSTTGPSPTFSGTADGDWGEASTVSVTVNNAGGTPVETVTAQRDSSTGSWSAQASPALVTGTYTAQATQSNLGSHPGKSAAVTFTVQSPPPPPPSGGSSPPSPPPSPGGSSPGPAPPADTTPPHTGILFGPAASTTRSTASFWFGASEPGSSLACRLDRGSWAPCRSPAIYRHLAMGRHVFYARATDSAGNADPSPAHWSWLIVRPGLAVSTTRLPVLLRQGLRLTVICPSACRGRLELMLDSRTARRAGLASRGRAPVVVAARTLSLSRSGRRTLVLSLSRRAARALRHLAGLTLTVDANGDYRVDGGRWSVSHRIGLRR